MSHDTDAKATVRTTIPARLDRLPWSPFHTRVCLVLGVCWILDGFEITVAGQLGTQLHGPGSPALGPEEIGLLAAVYLAGQVVGALVFGQLSDRFGRRRLFFVTLAIYFGGSAATALLVVGDGPVALGVLYLTRFVAGVGIGGEYAAINSMIDELIPALYRGRVDIAINGTYWAGAALAAGAEAALVAGVLPTEAAWRVAVLIGPVLALIIVFLRRGIPESPRWQILHDEEQAAERSLRAIEYRLRRADPDGLAPVDDRQAIDLHPVDRAGYWELLRVLFRLFPERATLGAVLMITQSLLYNAIFFSYASVLVRFFAVAPEDTPLYLLPFALGNLAGPLLLGPLFDKLGRRTMISRTYVMAGLLFLGSAMVFRAGGFDAATLTLTWCVVFVFASAGASAAYLTVSEVFPMEVRAKAIAVFFAIAQGFGLLGPVGLGFLLGAEDPGPTALFVGFVVGAVAMLIGGAVAWSLAVDAERRSLEDIATPLAGLRAGRRQRTSLGSDDRDWWSRWP